MTSQDLGSSAARDITRANLASEREQTSGSYLSSNLVGQLRAIRPRRLTPEVDLEGRRLASGRIEVGRRIGGGAMGIVYDATHDGRPVALKVLHRLQELQVYRLKTEFRRLSSINHPNVVSVYELFNEDGEWFFSMERVHGLPLHRALEKRQLVANTCCDTELRSLLRQLIEGVARIHEFGLVHRDIKPANILVDDQRLVIVDFGLVSEQHAGGVGQTLDQHVSGTLGYMAPEQMKGEPATTASDCYAIGATLYHLLVGHPPIADFSSHFAAAGSEVVAAGVPTGIGEDLKQLCVRLLSQDPARRPGTHELLRICRDWPGPERFRGSQPPTAQAFVGRERELGEMLRAFSEACAGSSSMVLVRGAPGVGKSALLRRFASQLRDDGVLVLEGRCSEWESVPYKGLDEIVDGLSRLLLCMPSDRAAQLVPRHVSVVVSVFPTLLRVPAFHDAAEAGQEQSSDPDHVRHRLATGLKDLFYRLAERHRLLLAVDDLQSADADTIWLLGQVLAQPDAPRLLLVGGAADDGRVDATLGPLCQSIRTTLSLAPLSEYESRSLVHAVMPSASEWSREASAASLVREANGVPFYLRALLEYATERPGHGAPTLVRLIGAQIENLAPPARQLLELVAVATRPLSLRVATQCSLDEVRASLRQLSTHRLVRSVMFGGGEFGFEPYSDSARLIVVNAMPTTRVQQTHAILVKALEALPDVEQSWLLAHYCGAGMYARARICAERAARTAERMGQFESAAEMYALALDHTHSNDAAWVDLNERYAGALERSGRGPQAAGILVRAARRASPERRGLLVNRAAAAWLKNGYLAEGTALLRPLLTEIGETWPETLAATRLGRWRWSLHRRPKGPVAKLRHESKVASDLVCRLDALATAHSVLGSFDFARGSMFAARALALATTAREPKRLRAALASDTVYTAARLGLAAENKVLTALRRLDELPTGAAEDAAPSRVTRALCAYWFGRWTDVRAPMAHPDESWGRSAPHTAWEDRVLCSIRDTVGWHRGDLQGIAHELPGSLEDAYRRADRWSVAQLLRRSVAMHLMRDNLGVAQQTVARLHEFRRTSKCFANDRAITAVLVATHLYADDVERAWIELRAGYRACEESGMLELPLVRVTLAALEAACVQADSSASELSARRLKSLARAVGAEKIAWAGALRHAILGASYEAAGQGPNALVEFRMAADLFEVGGLTLDAMALRWRAAVLDHRAATRAKAPVSGDKQVQAARIGSYFCRRGIVNLARFVRVASILY